MLKYVIERDIRGAGKLPVKLNGGSKMKRMALILALTFAAGIVMGVVGNEVLIAQQAPVKRTPLLQTDLVGMEGKEVILYLGEIAPGASSGKHYHPGPEVAYVLEGSGTLEMEGSSPKSVRAGDTLGYIPAKHVHEAKNASASEPFKVVVFMIGEKGQPLATPVTPGYFWK